MEDVEARVNDLVLADLAVHAEVMSQAEAVKSGAMALFGEKYGDEVRVISVGDWARELCGGTHALRSGLGVIKLMGESSIGPGVRRVEALVGGDAYRFLAREHVLVAQLSETRPPRAPSSSPSGSTTSSSGSAPREGDREGPRRPAAGRRGSSRPPRRTWRRQRRRAPRRRAGGGDVRTLALDVRGRLAPAQPGVVVIIGTVDSKVSVVAAVNDEARSPRISANALVRAIGPRRGKGGGKDDVAQGAAARRLAARRGDRASVARGRPPGRGPDVRCVSAYGSARPQ